MEGIDTQESISWSIALSLNANKPVVLDFRKVNSVDGNTIQNVFGALLKYTTTDKVAKYLKVKLNPKTKNRTKALISEAMFGGDNE